MEKNRVEMKEEVEENNLEEILLALWTKYRFAFTLADDPLFKKILKESDVLQSISSYKIRKKILTLSAEIRKNLVFNFILTQGRTVQPRNEKLCCHR